MTTFEETTWSRRKICTMRQFGRVAMDMFPQELTRRAGARTDHGEPSGPRAASAVSPWLFFRRSRPAKREENELARSFWTQRLSAQLPSDIYAAVLPHSRETETKGGELVGRRRNFSRVGSVLAPQDRPVERKTCPAGVDL